MLYKKQPYNHTNFDKNSAAELSKKRRHFQKEILLDDIKTLDFKIKLELNSIEILENFTLDFSKL